MKALVFDTETTGLVYNRIVKLEHQPEMVEWGSQLIDFDTGEIEDEYTTLIKPRHAITAFITSKNKITNEMVDDAPYFEDVVERIITTINEAPLVIAHNAAFDMEIVDIELERRDLGVMWPPAICSIEQTMHLKCKRLKNGELYTLMTGNKMGRAHRAFDDVKALVASLVELRKRGELPWL